MRSFASTIDWISCLWRDERGNVMMIMAAALFPILGLIGGGLDLTRAYLVKSKMQMACDSASLGARRAMASSTLDDASIAEGKRFFDFNFPAGTMQSAPVDLTIKANAADISTVDVTASTSVPTSIMAIFGIDRMPIDVACSADQDYVNNDIMLVLDVTGSMNCTAGNTSCFYAASEQPQSRLSRLRTATASLYKTLKDAKGVRTRYGFMPYSMTVNVGGSLPANSIRNPAGYWQVQNKKWVLASVNHNTGWFASWAGCVEERSTISRGPGTSIQISADVAEADIDTVGTVGAASDALKWAPYDEVATEGEKSSIAPNLAAFCPARATRLATYATERAFQDVVNTSLARVGGYTNHDLGIMWGMRFLSTTGMFATDNPKIHNPVPIGKHIIFLTDGEMTADKDNYSAFGIPTREDRMVGTGSLEQRHKDRFLNACNRARQMGATIWVIAIDVGASSDISPCASGSDHFFVSNGSDLDQVFQRIGKGIGRLRLTI